MIGKHHIRRSYWHKGYVFLLTYVEWMAACYWSTIKCEQELSMPEYKLRFQQEHDQQINGMIRRDLEMRRKEGERIDVDESKLN